MSAGKWDERTDCKLAGVGTTKNPPEVPRDQVPGTQEDPESRNRIVMGFYGPVVIPVAQAEEIVGEAGRIG